MPFSMINRNHYFFFAFRINAAHVPVKSHKTTLSFGAINCQCVISFYIMVLCLVFCGFKNNFMYTPVSMIGNNIHTHLSNLPVR